MQLFEIKNDIAKILYTPSVNHLLLADFLLIEDINQSIISQIIDIQSTNENDTNIATVKFSLSISKTANLSTYNGYTPAKTASIVYIDPNEIAQLIQSENANLYWGDLASHPNTKINLGYNLLKERPYIQCDKAENSKIITANIIYGLLENKKRTLVIDFDNRFKDLKSANLITISQEYKLPLNFEAFNFIAEHDLEDCSTENKAIIQGILLELQSYVQTLEEGFIPFDIFKSVIDEQCNQNPIPELLIFKNKLVKYQQIGLFAQRKEQFDFLDKIISKSSITIVEAGNIDEKWYKFILNTIYEQIEKKCYLITNLDENNTDDKLIEKLYQKENLRIVPVSAYKYSHAYKMKSLCKNLILFAPIEKTNDFEVYNSFLNKLNQKEFIIWSENTFYMPLIIKLKATDTSAFESKIVSEEIKSEVDKMLTVEAEKAKSIDEISKDINLKVAEIDDEDMPLNDDITDADLDFLDELEGIDEIESIDNTENKPEIIEEEFGITEAIEPEKATETQDALTNDNISNVLNFEEDNAKIDSNLINEETIQPESNFTEHNQIPEIVADEDIEFNDFEEETLVEEPTKKAPEVAVEPTNEFIQQAQENAQESNPTTNEIKIEQQTQPTPIQVEPEPIVESPKIQHSESPAIPPQTKVPEPVVEKKKPTIPIYEAKIENKNPEPIFKEGNFVFHAKYGKGIVEKIITYGNKTLCSIQFDNVGRRLLDPNLADIRLA